MAMSMAMSMAMAMPYIWYLCGIIGQCDQFGLLWPDGSLKHIRRIIHKWFPSVCIYAHSHVVTHAHMVKIPLIIYILVPA